MKQPLCFRKYRNHCLLDILLLILPSPLLLAMLQERIGSALVVVVALVVVAVSAIRNGYAYVVYQKKAAELTPQTGVIFNWGKASRRTPWGHVTLKHNGTEYESAPYFYHATAESMVGKEVSYVIVDDTLLIYEILG